MTYTNTRGVAFINNKKTNENSPDENGNIEFTREFAEALYMAAQYPSEVDNQGTPVVKVSLSLWNRQSKGGQPYRSISLSIENGMGGQAQSSQPHASDGGYKDRKNPYPERTNPDDEIPF